jgi:hypothetical protein
MDRSESFRALRRSNPRRADSFADAVDSAAVAVRSRLATATIRPRPRRMLVPVSAAGAAVATAAAVVAFLAVGGDRTESAAAAVRKAAAVTAASARLSGTAEVRITHGGRPWAGKSIRWHGEDLSVSEAGRERSMLLVDGVLYAPEDGAWVLLGDPRSIDPDSGTTPAEYLAAVREDVGGATLRRITRGMTGLETTRLNDGSVVYSGTVAAGLVAREPGFKEGHAIRVLPFGYVAHDEAADPNARLDAAVTVGADGIVRGIAVTWGRWRYAVSYGDLGAAPALAAPAHAQPLRP